MISKIPFSISETFNKNVPSNKAVLVYKNGLQLAHGIDYTFNNEGFE